MGDLRIDYYISLWNYTHCTAVPSLEHVLAEIRAAGYGAEPWTTWKDRESLIDETGRERLRVAADGMELTLHSGNITTFEGHKTHIDAAAHFGAALIVLHDPAVAPKDGVVDAALARDAVAYAAERNVTLALENGPLELLAEAIEKVDGLAVCFDVGHVYFTKHSMRDFVEALDERIVHLHLQDTLNPVERDTIPGAPGDHYVCGTGGIPRDDWEYLVAELARTRESITGAYELRPRPVLQLAMHARAYVEDLLNGKPEG